MSKRLPPYYAVIFTSTLSHEKEGYDEMAKKMEEIVQNQPGFLGMDSVRAQQGITISYWESLEAIDLWRHNEAHKKAMSLGKNEWYRTFDIKICKVLK